MLSGLIKKSDDRYHDTLYIHMLELMKTYLANAH